jgi:thiamine phosphate synthase YjbQ (UPF0047 family)
MLLVVPPVVYYNDRMVLQRELTLQTHSAGEMHDRRITRIVSESGVRTGIMQIFNVGSTAAIGAIEFEPGLKQDLPNALASLDST